MSESLESPRGHEELRQESGGESSESTELQRLDRDTIEPEAIVERIGSYQESEAIQETFTELMDSSLAVESQPDPGRTDELHGESQRVDGATLPEQVIKGQQRETSPSEQLEGVGGLIPDIDSDLTGGMGLDDDPFTGGGIGPPVGGDDQSEWGELVPNFEETIKQAQGDQEQSDPGTWGGGPGSVHPNYGESGRGMVGRDPDGPHHDFSGQVLTTSDQPYRAMEAAGSNADMAEAEMGAAFQKFLEGEAEGDQQKTDAASDEFEAAAEAYDAAKEEQAEARRKWEEYLRNKPDPSMEGADETYGGSDEAPEDEEDVDHSMDTVTDPAYGMGPSGASAVNPSRHPGHVSDPPYEGDSGIDKDSGIKAGAEQLTDPAEPEDGSRGPAKEG